jgi:hypothetical protein
MSGSAEIHLFGQSVKNNFTAVVAPTVNDDSDDGYAVGSVWIDTVTDSIYQCVDSTVGAAIWIEASATALAATIAPAGASLVGMLSVPGSTYETVEDMQNTFHSAGWISGGDVSDAGGATVDITAGTGFLRSTNSSVGLIFNIDWDQVLGIATTTDAANYVIVQWNGGAPEILTPLPTSDTSDGHTSWLLAVVVNEAGVLHSISHRITVGDHALRMIARTHAVNHIERDNEFGGLILDSTGANDISVTASRLYLGLDRRDIAALDTAAASTFDAYFNNGAGFTKESTGIGAWDNLQYENGGALATLGGNKYAVLWWYIELDGNLVMIYGNAEYNNAAAAAIEPTPASVPIRLQEHGILIGRFIFKESEAIAELVETVFTTVFATAGVTAHGDLTGIGTNTHAEIDSHLASPEPTKYIGSSLESGASYELLLTDAGKMVELTHGSACGIVIPANASVPIPVNTRIDLSQGGAGLLTVTITSDTLLGDPVSVGQNKGLSLWKKSATVWVIFGGTTA